MYRGAPSGVLGRERDELVRAHGAVAEFRQLRVPQRRGEARAKGLAHVRLGERRPVGLDDREDVLGMRLQVARVGAPVAHGAERQARHRRRIKVRIDIFRYRQVGPDRCGHRALGRRPRGQRRIEAVVRRAAGGTLAAGDPLERGPGAVLRNRERDREILCRDDRPCGQRRAVQAGRGEQCARCRAATPPPPRSWTRRRTASAAAGPPERRPSRGCRRGP